MNEEKKISVIIPAYNEEDAIGRVLDGLLPMADTNGWEVIVVDDGSTDATAKVVQQSGVKVITHPYNRGFSFSTTSTVAYYSMNFRVKYIPIKTKWRTGKSTVNQIKHGCETVLLMLRLIVLFNPLKVFMPVSLTLIFMGLAYQIYIIWLTGLHVEGGAIVSLIAGIQTFLFGLMIDQISAVRREKYL